MPQYVHFFTSFTSTLRATFYSMKAIILAAGKGSRFEGATNKLVYPINGTPVIVNAAKTAELIGATSLCVTVNSITRTSIEVALATAGYTTTYVEQLSTLGLCGALLEFSWLTEPFIVVLGDTYTQTDDLHKLYDMHMSKGGIVTTAYVEDLDTTSVRRACTLRVREDGSIISIIEKPVVSTGLRGCGLYICEPAIFKHMSQDIAFTDVIHNAAKRTEAYAVRLAGVCNNVNTITDTIL